MANLNFLIYLLFSAKLRDFKNKKMIIIETAVSNEYPKNLIDNTIRNKKFRLRIKLFHLFDLSDSKSTEHINLMSMTEVKCIMVKAEEFSKHA